MFERCSIYHAYAECRYVDRLMRMTNYIATHKATTAMYVEGSVCKKSASPASMILRNMLPLSC